MNSDLFGAIQGEAPPQTENPTQPYIPGCGYLGSCPEGGTLPPPAEIHPPQARAAGHSLVPFVPGLGMNTKDPEAPLSLAGYLNTQIGKVVRVVFLIGSSLEDRSGVLTKVGTGYLLLKPLGELFTVVCDLHSVKFVSILNEDLPGEVVMLP